jgi:trimeric autotransporter adhesin
MNPDPRKLRYSLRLISGIAMTLHRCIRLTIVATLCACGGSTAPKVSNPQGTISIPTAGGSVNLPSAGGYSAALQIASGAPSGVTITATASTTAPASASVVARGSLRTQVQANAVPILYETLTVSADVAAQYFLSETFSTSTAPSAAGGLYYVSIVDVTTGTSLGDFSAANPGGTTGTVTVHDTFFTITGAPVISFNPGDSYVFEFYYVPLASVIVSGRTSVVGISDTLQLTLSAVYSDTTIPVAVQGAWTSSNPAVATVDASTGLVTGVSAGSAIVTGTLAGKSAADTLTVSANSGFTVQTVTSSGTDTLVVPFSNSGSGAFVVVGSNMAATSTGTVTLSTSTGGATLPLTATICQTNANGQCLAAPTATVETSFAPGGSATFSVFVTASAAITNNPTLSVLFTDGTNAVIGSGSVIVKTQ